jgi:histidine ammonia-lyase
VEWLGACQGLDFREGLKSTPALEQARQALRAKVPYYVEDRFFARTSPPPTSYWPNAC